MNANVLKPNTPFISRKELKRKPPSADYVERVKFMNSNEFSFSICKDSQELRSTIKPKKSL